MRDGLLRNQKMIVNRPRAQAPVMPPPVRHLCWCGQEGHFGFVRGGPLFCSAHVATDADGATHHIPQS